MFFNQLATNRLLPEPPPTNVQLPLRLHRGKLALNTGAFPGRAVSQGQVRVDVYVFPGTGEVLTPTLGIILPARLPMAHNVSAALSTVGKWRFVRCSVENMGRKGCMCAYTRPRCTRSIL